MRLSLDHSLLVARRPGQPDRLPREQLQARVARCGPVQADLLEAISQGFLPHGQPQVHPEAEPLAATWAEEHDRIVVFGEAGAVAGATLWHPGEGLHCVRTPDGSALRRALIGAKAPLLIVLDGPPWVRSIARSLTGVTSLWVRGDGTGDSTLELPPGATVLEVAHGADLRFAPFSMLAQALAAHGGLHLGSLLQSWQEALEACAGKAMFSNPALLLAALADALDDDGRGAPCLVAPTEALARWSEWAQAAWTAITVKPSGDRALRAPRGGRPQLGMLGDEALAQRLAAGPEDTWALMLVWEGGPPEDRHVRATLLEAEVKLLAQSRRPVLRLKVSDNEPGALMALSFLIVHAALALAALRGLAPLALPAADRLRALMRELDDPTPAELAGRD